MLKTLLVFFLVLSNGTAIMAASDRTQLAKPVAESQHRVIMGWLESIFIRPWNLRLTAKLDTGAKTSSLHADRIEHFSKNGEDWVRFTLGDLEDRKQPPIIVEKPLLRTVNIKCKSEDCQSSKRDVVLLTLCKNGSEYQAEFNLVDRSNFNYPVLLGRAFLKDVALVDANETFLFKYQQDPCFSKDGPLVP